MTSPIKLPPKGHPLRKLGARLAELLDEYNWIECERMLLEGWEHDAAAIEADRQEVKDEQQCSDFWAWIRHAYREPESVTYTVYNMEVAYQAGRASVEADRQRRGEPVVLEGFRLVAVNQTFDDLLFWLDRCEYKGHLDNCFDLVKPWEAFEYREVGAPQPTEPVAWYTDDHLTDKSATTWDRTVAARWRDKGWPVGELFAAPQPSTEGVCKNHPQQTPVKDIPEYAEIYVGNGKFAICDWSDFDLVKGFKWHLTSKNKSGCLYAQSWDSGNPKTRNKQSMHRMIMAVGENQIIDHINGNGLDNRRSNLRVVSAQQNAFNQKGHGGSSRFKGVSFDKESGKWRAYISHNNKRVNLGRHFSEIDAAKAYDVAAKEYFGEYAKLNLG